VKNTGPSDFHHTIKFVDQPANGTKITNVTVVNPQVAWNCNPVPGAPTSCKSGGAVHLLLGQSKLFHVTVAVPKAVAIANGCKIVNSAHILAPFGGSPQNINPNDDADAALASIPLPASQCSKNNLPSNLKIEKTYMNGNAPCKLVGGVSYCTFKVTVTNTGPGLFSGAIFVHDMPSLGTTVWTPQGCANPVAPPGLHAVTCVINAPNLPVNGQKSFKSIVRVPKAVAKFYQCQIENSARITAPLGPPKNWNPADDHAQAAADISGVVCAQPNIITTTPPPPPPPRMFPHCPPGTIGAWPHCHPLTVHPCPRGTIRRGHECVTIEPACPRGTVRHGRECVTIERACPRGTVRHGHECVIIERACPRGTVRRGHECVTIERACPRGTVRHGHKCIEIRHVCPRGTVGKWPHCMSLGHVLQRPPPRGAVNHGLLAVPNRRP
jgi:hypothetical protein